MRSELWRASKRSSLKASINSDSMVSDGCVGYGLN